jgi:hypothetical protein
MKRYVPIVIGVIALCAVLFIANSQMKENRALSDEEQQMSTVATFTNKVIRNFEGENVLEYGFTLPDGATTTVEQDGALVKVTDSSSTLLTAMYFSYEGGRGYSPEDYITHNIVPHVSAVTSAGTTTIGMHEWTVVESEFSVWHVAKSDNGQWLIVVENRKDVADKALVVLESILTK